MNKNVRMQLLKIFAVTVYDCVDGSCDKQ